MTDPMSTLALVGGGAAVLLVFMQAGSGRRKGGFNPADYRAKPLYSHLPASNRRCHPKPDRPQTTNPAIQPHLLCRLGWAGAAGRFSW